MCHGKELDAVVAVRFARLEIANGTQDDVTVVSVREGNVACRSFGLSHLFPKCSVNYGMKSKLWAI